MTRSNLQSADLLLHNMLPGPKLATKKPTFCGFLKTIGEGQSTPR